MLRSVGRIRFVKNFHINFLFFGSFGLFVLFEIDLSDLFILLEKAFDQVIIGWHEDDIIGEFMFLLFFRLANHVEVGGEIHFLEFFINVLVVFGAYYNFVDVPSSKFVDEAVY